MAKRKLPPPLSNQVEDYHDYTWPDMPIERRKRFHVGPLYLNAIHCKECDWIVRSRNRHDYRTCHCGGCSIDGGSAYVRASHAQGIKYELITVPFTHLEENEL